jgi:short-subunit dehydrogenase
MSKVIVLTGASSGLGRAAALQFARRGDHLVLSARGKEALEETAGQCRALGANVATICADIRDEEQVKEIARTALTDYGAIDVWVNNAGTTLFAPLASGDFAPHRQVIETNLFGAIYGARAVVPLFRERGRGILINVGSVLSAIGQAFVPAYVISKFGLRGLSETLRVELAPYPNIHVCLLLPYAIDTPHFEHGGNAMGRKAHPVPPVQEPEKVAAALVDLVDRPRRVRYVPRVARLGLAVHALFPRRVESTLLEVLERWHFSDPQATSDGNLHAPPPEKGAIHGTRPPLTGTARLLMWAAARLLAPLPRRSGHA